MVLNDVPEATRFPEETRQRVAESAKRLAYRPNYFARSLGRKPAYLIGVPVSFGLTRFLASQVWGVSATDPWTFASVVVCVLVVGLLACSLPARRAAQVDPLITLRYE